MTVVIGAELQTSLTGAKRTNMADFLIRTNGLTRTFSAARLPSQRLLMIYELGQFPRPVSADTAHVERPLGGALSARERGRRLAVTQFPALDKLSGSENAT